MKLLGVLMEKVHFTAEKATNLATLYGRALDYRSA